MGVTWGDDFFAGLCTGAPLKCFIRLPAPQLVRTGTKSYVIDRAVPSLGITTVIPVKRRTRNRA
jgi:hypothetical protein